MPVKYQTLMKILALLLSRKRVTAAELAERYDLSERTIYRYIEDLTIAGIPLEVKRGRYGGIMLSDTYSLPAGYLTREEYAAARNALQAWADQAGDPAAVTALSKLESRQKSDRRELSVCGNIIIDGGAWGDMGAFTAKLRSCERAVDDGACLDIDYISREGEHSRRIIDPYVLILKRNVWYVYAFCHTKQSFRTFKIGRIKRLMFTGEHFERKNISKADIPLNFSYSDEEMTEVTLEIARTALADAEEWLGVDSIEPRGRALTCTIKLPKEGLVNKILSFGGAVKVMSPASIAEEVKSAAAHISGQYAE